MLEASVDAIGGSINKIVAPQLTALMLLTSCSTSATVTQPLLRLILLFSRLLLQLVW